MTLLWGEETDRHAGTRRRLPRRIGCARTSTVDQVAGFEAQVKELAAAL
ncbi:MAG: hypothetical protein JO069_02995 [Verrucomicrobia bacterium]|nr:hypothetical protein [Verrucomicrobiota bacterium]